MVDVAVLGAGPAGLWAAWRLASRGVGVEVYEAADRVGGMSASITVGGQRVDLGSHRLHPAAGDRTIAALRSMGVDLQVRERNGRLRLGARWVRFPLRTGDVVRRVPPGLAARLVRDAATGPLRSADRSSFAGVVRSGLGPTVADEFYGPYARKLWGLEPDALHPTLADRRVSATSPLDVVRRLVRARRPDGRRFLYPRSGYGEIVERLADAATDAGATIHTSTPVDSLTGLGADHVWSTIPITATARLAGVDPAPFDLRTRAMVLVYLVVDRDRYTAFDAHYVPDESVAVARLSEPKNYRDGDDPAGRTVLCAEVPCSVGDDLWNADDGTLAAKVTAELVSIGLPDPDVVDHHAVRLPSVYPVFDLGAPERFRALRDRLDEVDRLVVFGRQGLFVPDNLHHVVAMAEAAVAALDPSTGRFDRVGWGRSRLRFDDHVVED